MTDLPLMAYAENWYSQAGEDGIIAEIWRRLCEADGAGMGIGLYMDIGAGDGLYMSNTARLWDCGWLGLAFEADQAKADAFSRCPGARCICNTVTPENINELWPHRWSHGCAVFSLDIDGPDIHVWRALAAWRPTVCIMEVHAAWPLHYLHEPDINAPAFGRKTETNIPASFTSMLNLGLEKGYTLVAYTGLNMIFVDNAVADNVIFDDLAAAPERLYLDGPQRKRYRELVEEKTRTRETLTALARGLGQ